MAAFSTQDGAGRAYTDQGYAAAQAAGGARRSPGGMRPGGGGMMPFNAAVRPTGSGYVPTYAKYADPGVSTMAGPPESSPAAPSAAPQRPAVTPGASAYYTQRGTPGLLNGYFDAFKNGLSGAVQGYGDIAGQDFKQQVGTMLGNLNAIGGLRSGGVQAGINQAMAQYGRQIGDYASMTANQAGQLAQNENDLSIERKFRDDQLAAQQRAQHKSFLGKLLGGGLGVLAAVPGIGKVAGGILGAAGTAAGNIFG